MQNLAKLLLVAVFFYGTSCQRNSKVEISGLERPPQIIALLARNDREAATLSDPTRLNKVISHSSAIEGRLQDGAVILILPPQSLIHFDGETFRHPCDPGNPAGGCSGGGGPRPEDILQPKLDLWTLNNDTLKPYCPCEDESACQAGCKCDGTEESRSCSLATAVD